MKRVVIVVIACGFVVLLIALEWVLLRGRKDLRLVLRLPLEECRDLRFAPWGLARGPSVEAVCRAHGIKDRWVFALRGKTAVRFVPYEFHGVHGTLEVADAEEEVVYIYQYGKRYRPIIEAP